MLKIRLQRVRKKNSPSYRVVLCEHTAPPQGKFIEILGFYNARLKKKGFKKDRIEYWFSKGAQASPTVHNLLIDEGILKGIKLKAWRPKKRAEAKSTEGGKEEVKPEGVGKKPKEEPKREEKSIEEPSEAPSEAPKEEVKTEEPKSEEKKLEEGLDPVRLSENLQKPRKDNEKSNGIDKESKID